MTPDKIETSARIVGAVADELYLKCIRCGKCLSVCPVYRETRIETLSPRGKVALCRAVAEDDLEVSEVYADRFYTCLMCEACREVCPSGVELDVILNQSRAYLAHSGLMPASLRRLSEIIVAAGNISNEDNEQRLGWITNMASTPVGLDHGGQAEVAYFVGCVSSLFPASYRIPQSLVQTFEKIGVNYALMGSDERCCGYPLLLNGEVERAVDMARHNVEAVRATGATKVVTACPSCYHMWKHTYLELLDDGELDGLEILHETELLAELARAGRLRLKPWPVTVTYHDPCDLGRKSGIFEAPREVLRAIPELTLVEMADHHENSLCCGGGGNLETYDRELAQALPRRRLKQAQEAEAEYIVVSCQQCKRTLLGAARRERIRIRTMDLAEVVAGRIEGENDA
ncbi:MAG TPA: (Fe-S)-binding protein [Anaerolineae bacterium]|nr:(Fe-S)-binding protein [Anaerolineae bacterium]